jgi:hypothetical protein
MDAKPWPPTGSVTMRSPKPAISGLPPKQKVGTCDGIPLNEH